LTDSSVEGSHRGQVGRWHSAVCEHSGPALSARTEGADEGRELRSVNTISAVEISVLSNLNNFKRRRQRRPSGEHGQQRHYDPLFTYRLQIGGIARSLSLKPACLHPDGWLPERHIPSSSGRLGLYLRRARARTLALTPASACVPLGVAHTISRWQRNPWRSSA
jgi:hypothetical protein